MKIVADDGHQADFSKKRGCHGEIGGRAAESALHLSIGAFQRIICNRADDK